MSSSSSSSAAAPKKKQVQLFLIPTPGAKPEFLATLEGANSNNATNNNNNKYQPSSSLDSSLPEKIVLENYTRDAWAWKPNPSIWQSVAVQAVDGRNKLPGFLKYLKERQKSAYGRFADKEAIWVISYIQKSSTTTTTSSSNYPTMECRFSWDVSTIPKLSHEVTFECCGCCSTTRRGSTTTSQKSAAAAAAEGCQTQRWGGLVGGNWYRVKSAPTNMSKYPNRHLPAITTTKVREMPLPLPPARKPPCKSWRNFDNPWKKKCWILISTTVRPCSKWNCP